MAKFISSLLIAAFGLLVGCRASPAPDAGFLKDPKLMARDDSVPFNRIWTNPAYRTKTYTEIYIAPVNTDYVMAENIWEKASLTSFSPEYVKQNVKLLADYQRTAFVNAVQKEATHKLKVVDKPGPNTLVLEMAIVQLVPSKVLLQAASYYTWAASVAMVGGSVVTGSQDQGKGVIAMEARTRDGATGDITSMFADREHPPTAVIDVKALFWWEPAKPICDGWARQFVQLETSPKGTKIEEIPNFQLLVW